jgi:hypothetical protein
MFKNIFTTLAAMWSASAVFAQTVAPAVVPSGAVAAADLGILASISLFIAGWAIAILVVLALFGIIAEHNDSRGWAIFWMILAAAVAYFAFSISLTSLIIGAVAYIVIGLFWSFWRYKRHATKVVEKFKTATAIEKERALKALHPKEMLSTITAWIMIWPFSMIENMIGDLITGIQMLVTKFFRGVYHKVYDSAVAALR